LRATRRPSAHAETDRQESRSLFGEAKLSRLPSEAFALNPEEASAMPEFPSLAHIAVTVTDLDRSTQWYTALFGSGPVLDEDEASGTFHHTVYALSGGQLFGLHTHTQPATETFDERHTGLDHVAFACSGRNELQRWADRLK